MDLNRIVEEIVRPFRSSTSGNIVVKTDLGRDLPGIEADTAQIRRVVLSLVTNASEAIGKEQEGTITVSTGVMRCTSSCLAQSCIPEIPEERRFVLVDVTDTGRGMNRETIEKLFDPFFTTKFPGRGLEMAAVA